ncbi:hypothetical protein [Weissella confusa]|uniref:hypothetical protein n=1 Tax=Weissella confusa TaxID=1583 RepID=UPI00058710C1|nr:hypothetical protein [Weissella confusa]MBJ7616200.1 hypothetical protein [Weissella confusa]MBJ7626526.1 hypothetical protein [Weissella confusa]MBJ7689573.1 hypothetical protein [Weissella confusa]MBJ7699820.1 hypothetical protein [Weissella confusa]MCS9995929.1 hypothetical protein [Weissella confusa]
MIPIIRAITTATAKNGVNAISPIIIAKPIRIHFAKVPRFFLGKIINKITTIANIPKILVAQPLDNSKLNILITDKKYILPDYQPQELAPALIRAIQ